MSLYAPCKVLHLNIDDNLLRKACFIVAPCFETATLRNIIKRVTP